MSTLTVRDCMFSYQQTGSGADLVWGHGLSSSMVEEDELRFVDWTQIDTDHRVLRYDARGHGESSSTIELADYSWENLARDQLAIADALGIERYIAAGASMGAATALHAAVLAPQRIRALVMALPPTAWATRSRQAARYAAMADLIEAGNYAKLIADSKNLPPPDPLVEVPEWTSASEEKLTAADPVRLARVFRAAGSADLPTFDQISTVTVPTLILGWTGDTTHPLTTVARLQELMPHAEVAIATTMAGVAAWTGRVRDFLRRCPPDR